MQRKQPPLRFNKKFLWGAATSAHQVEGGTHNQWTVWELEHAKTRVAQAKFHLEDLPSWDYIKTEATKPQTYVSGKAINHYNLYEQDFDLLGQLSMNAFRFSVEWSRIEPTEGVWNVEAITHYKTYVKALKRRGVEPIVTLFHFTLPVWFSDSGGFEKRANVQYFVRFAEKILHELGADIKYVITINEPEVYAYESYFTGHWPPGQTSRWALRRVLANLARAHNIVADILHKTSRRYKVSVAKNSNYFYAGDDAWLSQKSAGWLQFFQDDYFLRKVAKRCDFLGINFYFSNRVYGYRVHNPDTKVSDMGWDLSPADLQYALERLHETYKKPIFITENGLADATDQHRQWWLTETILAMQRAQANGVELWGYLHWSLLDNFEWDKGKWPRFGLAAVDYATLDRQLRPSALWFGRVIKKLRKESR
jgi:beta-glucosidase